MKKNHTSGICLFLILTACVFLCLSSCGNAVDIADLIAAKGSINVYTSNNSKDLTGLEKTEFALGSQEVTDADFRRLEEEFKDETILGLEFINVKKISGVFRKETTSLSDLVFDSALESIGDDCFRVQEYLTRVEFKGENVPSVSETAFPSNYKENGEFFYPADKESEYKKVLKPFLAPEDTSLYMKRLKIGEENILDIPEGKDVYTLILNIPETFGSGKDISVKITPSASGSRPAQAGRAISAAGLIPLDDNGDLETDKIKTDRPNVFLLYNQEIVNKNLVYLGENTESNILYFIEEGAKESMETPLVFINKDGQEESFSLDIKKSILPKIDAVMNEKILQAERDYYGLTGYDADETGYFHVVFYDFGEEKTKYYGKLQAGGTVGMYLFFHIRNYSPTENEFTNGADMFFVNSRYIEYCTKNFYEYVHTEHSSSEKLMDGDKDMMSEDYFIDAVCNDIIETFLHEYMHYLMDANLYLKNKEDEVNDGEYIILKGEKTPLFWMEGTAESTANLFKKDKTTNLHSGYIFRWIQNANTFAPYIGEGKGNGYTEDSCISYAVAPMFFMFIREVYGEEAFKKCCTYTDANNNLNTIIQDCTGKSFSELYREFLIRLFASVAGDSSYGTPLSFLDNWSFTTDSFFSPEHAYVPAVDENTTELYSQDKHNLQFKNGTVDIADGCISLLKWSDNPASLTLTSDEENIEAYVLYL